MQDTSKRMKRLVREWAGIAHERELHKALTELNIQFGRWERSEIDSFELNDAIHRFHDGASREIWKRYDTNHVEPAVAWAAVSGIMRKDELPTELLTHLANWIGFYEADRSSA